MRRPRCTERRRRLAGSGSSSSSCTRRRRMEPDDHASTAIRAACTFGDRDDLAKATAAVEHVISAVKAPQHRRPRQPSEVFAIDCNAGPRTGDIVSHQRPMTSFEERPQPSKANRPCGSSFMRSPTNLGNFLRTLATPEPIKDWSLTSLKEKLIKIGAKVVSHGRYVAFQMAEVAIPRQMFQEILRLIAELRPQPPPAPA